MIPPGETAALILAAGRSSRMRVFKPLVLLKGRPLIEWIVETYRAAGVERIITVVGHEAERLIPVLAELKVGWIMNPRYREEMLTSIKAGLKKLPHPLRAFFLQPGDMPLVRPETIGRLSAGFDPESMDILRPRHRGNGGHPVLISAAGIPSIESYDGPGGLRGLIQRGVLRALDLEVDDPGILVDLDTPGDLKAALMIIGDD
jgi:CTP:molybdopterin cytidylyltransferase MocA